MISNDNKTRIIPRKAKIRGEGGYREKFEGGGKYMKACKEEGGGGE